MKRAQVTIAAATGCLLAVSTAMGSGFKVNEQSAQAVGAALAGAASRSESPSDLFANPAAAGFMERPGISVALGGILPTFDFRDGAAFNAGGPISGRSSDSADVDALVPSVYAVMPLNKTFVAGLAITTPWGLATEYSSGWIGRYHALDSDLLTINITPSIAWRVNPQLSLGLGLQAQYADAKLTSAVDFGLIGANFGVPNAIPGAADGKVKVEGDDWAYGFVLGAQLRLGEATRVGLSYRSRIDHELEGDARFTPDAAGVASFLQTVGGRFTNTRGRADLDIPEVITLSVDHQLSPAWKIAASAMHTRWSRFDELRVRFANPNQPDSVTIEDWDNVTMYSIGVSYHASERWTWRGGVAYDESPVPTRTRTPRIPDSDRYWLSLGASYRATPTIGIHAAYLHVFAKDADLRLDISDPGNEAAGSLTGEYEADADVIMLEVDARF